MGGHSGHDRIARDRARDGDGTAAYLEADVLGEPTVRDALSDMLGTGGPPLVAHRAKELIHGLAIDIRSLRYDTAVMAYLLDPAPGKYVLEDLALRYLALEVSSPDAEPGTLDLDGDIEIDQTGRRALAALQLAEVLEAALTAVSSRISTSASSAHSCGFSRTWSARASGSTGGSSRS